MALKGKKKEEKTYTYEVEVTRAKELKDSYAFDMRVNGVMIYGCWLKETKDGNNFVSFPSYKGTDGKYYSHAYFKVTDELQDIIEKGIEALV